MAAEGASQLAVLTDIPQVDFPANLQAALAAGRRMSSILAEVIALRRGPGKLTPAEYFYYRLWEPGLSRDEKRRFVGKQAQHPMHVACNSALWYASAADKLVFHTLLAGAGLPRPDLLAITHPGRLTPSGRVLTGADDIARFLREPANYPLFGKPIDGRYSLAVLSADEYDPTNDQVRLHGATPVAPTALAAELAARPSGYLLQRRLAQHPALARHFGPRLWSVRAIVLLTAGEPTLHRAVAKIATGQNPADNFWRPGNMVGAVDLSTGRIMRVVQGTGADMAIDAQHPDTGQAITGTSIPAWQELTELVGRAARLLPAIRTQSWDIALTETGPVPLEANFGGDLNLAQLASGAGALDAAYSEHLRHCGYRL
jgi:hypothetical protein